MCVEQMALTLSSRPAPAVEAARRGRSNAATLVAPMMYFSSGFRIVSPNHGLDSRLI